MSDVLQPDREFGLQLASGVTVGPGTFVKVNSDGQGALAGASGDVHGYSLTSGAGTKTAGINQRVLARRHGLVNYPNGGFTAGGTLYSAANGGIATSGTVKVGFALGAAIGFIDLDTTGMS